MRGLGDIVHAVAHPVAKHIIDPLLGTDLANCEGCGQRRDRWNDWTEAVFANLRGNKDNGDMNQVWIVVLQIAVQGASDAKDAIAKADQGTVIVANAYMKPETPKRVAGPIGPGGGPVSIGKV